MLIPALSISQINAKQSYEAELDEHARNPKGRSNSMNKQRAKNELFIADTYTKNLKAGKLPFKKNNDRIARYGQGFSNLLSMAGTTEPP